MPPGTEDPMAQLIQSAIALLGPPGIVAGVLLAWVKSLQSALSDRDKTIEAKDKLIDGHNTFMHELTREALREHRSGS